MPRLHRAVRVGAIGLVFLGACGEKAPPPAGPSSTPAAPPVPAAATPTAIRLDGPSSLAPGVSVQYRVTASYADGTTRDITNQSSILATSGWWGILRIARDGTVTGGDQGEADVTAYYPAGQWVDETTIVFGPGRIKSPPLRVVVLEPGTFRVSGVVTESGLPFPGIAVHVVAGKRAGLQVPTNSNGEYALYGLAGSTDLAVQAEGFHTRVRSLVLTDHQTVDFDLEPVPHYDSLTGNWRLTLTAAPDCGPDLPDDAAVRTYDARIVQRGPQLGIEVSFPNRVILEGYRSDGFGSVGGDTMSLRFQSSGPGEYDPPRWSLLELLAPRRFLGIGFLAEGRRAGNTITGWLSGTFAIFRSAGANYLDPGTVLESSCYRKVGEHDPIHSFRLERN